MSQKVSESINGAPGTSITMADMVGQSEKKEEEK